MLHTVKMPILDEHGKPEFLLGFSIDITERITDHVSVSPAGIKVTGAQLPHGHHHLVMMIGDQQGHFGLQEAVFDIK